MAGPWFTVQENGDSWQELSHIWISNGDEDCQGKVEIKVEMEQSDEDS